jgi:hypothetical protein
MVDFAVRCVGCRMFFSVHKSVGGSGLLDSSRVGSVGLLWLVLFCCFFLGWSGR